MAEWSPIDPIDRAGGLAEDGLSKCETRETIPALPNSVTPFNGIFAFAVHPAAPSRKESFHGH